MENIPGVPGGPQEDYYSIITVGNVATNWTSGNVATAASGEDNATHSSGATVAMDLSPAGVTVYGTDSMSHELADVEGVTPDKSLVPLVLPGGNAVGRRFKDC